jgi:hypothetical protein
MSTSKPIELEFSRKDFLPGYAMWRVYVLRKGN